MQKLYSHLFFYQMYATATVLKDYSNYWVDFRSEKFTVKSKVKN